jgi:hypothetical protein
VTATNWHIIHAFVEIIAWKDNNKFIYLGQTQKKLLFTFV